MTREHFPHRPHTKRIVNDGTWQPVATRHMLGLAQGFPGARRFRQLLSADIHKSDQPLAIFDQAAELLQGR